MLKIKTFKGGFDSNFCYIIYDSETKDCAILDTSINPKELLKFIDENNLKLNFAVIMHSHFDHIVGYEFYRENGIELLAHDSLKKEVDQRLNEGDELKLGSHKLIVLHTPGHIYDCICILIDNKLFTSDTLFVDGCGRCDLVGADVEHMYGSLYNKILKLSDETIIYPGHDYGRKPFDTLKNQKKTNHYLTAASKEEFINERMGI